MLLRSLSTLYRLRANQYLAPDKLRALQNRKLRKLLRHAYENVPYYRELFNTAGLHPGDIASQDDLYKIPVTTKQDLQKIPQEAIIARGTDTARCVVKYTSGSTGQPLKVFISPEERDFQILLNLRILLENGMKLTDKVVYLINPHRFPKSTYWFQRLGILRREYFSVFDYPEKHAEALLRINPDIIYGYPSNLTLLALYIRDHGLTGINPKTVFSLAEALDQKARSIIDTTMKTSTCDILGTIELGDIAWQCEKRGGYHISADAVIIEFLQNGEPAAAGAEGKTVCTNLHNYTMPLIRYAVDDICVPSDRQCSCGRTLPMMESIKGRANDFIMLPDGKVIASCFLVIIMQAYHDVAQYRVVQTNANSLTIQIVAGRGYGPLTAARIKDEIAKAVQGQLCVAVENLDELPRDRSGKIRTVVSTVLPDLQHAL